MYWAFRFLRPLIARGFEPALDVPAPDWRHGPPRADGGEPPVVVFCPTMVTPDNRNDQRAAVDALVEQIVAARAGTARRFTMLIGIQHDASNGDAARRRLDTFARRAGGEGVAFAGFALQQRGKVLSLNVALSAARAVSAHALVQVDDDVHNEPGCLEALVREYDAHGGGIVVGAAKIPVARFSRTSKSLRWLRRHSGHACDYPHGCCLIFDPMLLPPEIPRRYVSDDGFICFSALRPEATHPMALLRLSSVARCRYFVGGTPWQSVKRIRRLLLNAHLLIAGFPPATGEFYYRHLLFNGLWPIGAGAAPSRPRDVGRWLLRCLYFWIFTGIGMELACRGISRRPLRSIVWSGVRDRAAPRPAQAIPVRDA